MFAKANVEAIRRADGTLLFRSTSPLAPYPRAMNESLVYWAQKAPDRLFLAERSASGGTWNGVTYREALDRVERIAGALLQQNAPGGHPVAILSDNTVEHGLLMLAALHVGIPAASISPAYSLISSDFAKLKAIVSRLRPALIYADDFHRYLPALRAIDELHEATVVAGGNGPAPEPGILRFADLDCSDAAGVTRAFDQVSPHTIAKILFTSGSTDEPKGVINTQRMLCASQQAKLQIWPFLGSEPPVLMDWLPWNHTFGGNHNFNLVLRNGGTLYIDDGKPSSALFSRTVQNLEQIAPTMYFNVPRGFELLVEALSSNRELRRRFFSRLKLIFYAGAGLPKHLWEALVELGASTTGATIPVVSAWGSTETSPLATDCYGDVSGPGVIGLPVPGCELKLLPNADKMEVRVKGPNVFPGYWGRADLTARHFDEDGFYRIGDAVRFVDPEAPELGLVFDGRVSEDFKLTTGTWVSVGKLRMNAISALAPIAQDIVVAGHDRDEVRLLVFPNIAACRALCKDLAVNTPIDELLASRQLREHVSAGLRALQREFPASSTHATAALLLQEPPAIDAGEITDKGYINQRMLLTRRQHLVDVLFSRDHPSLVTLTA